MQTRRAAPLATVLALLLSTGCSAQVDPASGGGAPSEPAAEGGPVTVTDARGEVVILDEVPERIVLTSYRQVLDELLLLDAPPVAFGADRAEELPPWTQAALDEVGVEVARLDATGGVTSFEALAELRPDVIIANEYETDSFDTYASIAPLVVLPDGFDLEGERLAILGDLTGEPEAAQEQIATLTAGFDEVLPTDDEVAVVFGFSDGAPKLAVEWGDVEGREGELLTELGVDVKSDWPFEKNEYGYAEVAEENFFLVDEADVALNIGPYPGNWDADKAALEGSEVLTSTRVFQEGRFHFLTPEESQALVQWTPLATPTLVAALNRTLQD